MKEKDLQDALINRVLLKDLVKTVFDLRIIYREFPKFFEPLMEYILGYPNEFKRLIKDENDLYQLLILYPKYGDVLGQKTVQDAVAAMHSRADIIKSARLLYQSVRTNSGISTQLPTELLCRIGLFARNMNIHRENEAKNIFRESFTDPFFQKSD